MVALQANSHMFFVKQLLAIAILLPLTSPRAKGQTPPDVDATAAADAAASPVRFPQVAAILSKYCLGCHNDTDREGDFSMSSLAALRAGSPDGPVLVAGDPSHSRLLQLISGEQEPMMPPEGEPRPTAEQIALLRLWIEQGASSDAADMTIGPTSTLSFVAPQLAVADMRFHHMGAACAVTDQTYALGSLGEVQLRTRGSDKPNWTASGLAGKVNSLRPSPDGRLIVVGGGIAGLGGEAVLLNAQDGSLQQRFLGHRDTIYCAAVSPDGRWLATGGYDRVVALWESATGSLVREITGHNGAIYDLDFDPSGQLLATASGDQTIKVWRVDSGERLDTLGQPEGEQRCVRFSLDGKFIFAAGSDKQIRKWQVVSREQPAINPMLVARYAHESDILQLQFVDGQRILSSSTDRTVKLWDADQIRGLGTVAKLSEVPVGLCVNADPEGQSTVVQLDGQQIALVALSSEATRRRVPQPEPAAGVEPSATTIDAVAAEAAPALELNAYLESEPNDLPHQAANVALPATFSGVIDAPADAGEDQDLVRFSAVAGETWIFEVAAARNQSPLDSRIDILDARGEPVLRTRLQAMRASYFTFRGKDSMTSDDFRLHRWEDMELDEYLYTNGEVNRLWHYPRGPDSGFRVYPGEGNRYTFFDTTPLAHPLGQTNYIVRELAENETPTPNGLPVFPVLYENDDDAMRRLGKDSRLTFIAPTTGDYFLRIRDARGFAGEDFRYQVTIRQPRPDFKLKLAGTKLSMPFEGGREWSVAVERIDGLDAPIAIELQGLPEGVLATNPVIVEAGQEAALGCLFLTEAARSQLGERTEFEVQLTATTQVAGQTRVKALEEKLVVTITSEPEVQVRLVAVDDSQRPLEELSIRPGQTISARVVVARNGTESRIELGGDSSGRNLPHGAYVDNIGLNGLLIPEGQTEREFFITAAPKVAPGRRQFHLRSGSAGNPTSPPVWLNVLAPGE